jgi:hypothetical protein
MKFVERRKSAMENNKTWQEERENCQIWVKALLKQVDEEKIM